LPSRLPYLHSDLSHAAVGVRFLGAAASSQRGAAVTNADGSVSGVRAGSYVVIIDH
jgi:hypothetical protein